ncbi:MAG: GC-type dockerin domain-anchored protein [Phycisphaerales bacterium JB059]
MTTTTTRLAAGMSAASLLATGALAQNRMVVFVHDQTPDQILRLTDLNADGDAHDPGEATVFFDDAPPVTGVDNAQGMVALDAHTLLATDNFDPDNIVLLRDLDMSGDAFGPGENTVWFGGMLPSALTMTNPAELRRRADGSYFLLDNNTLDTTRPEAIYILKDLNSDDDVDDPGEISQFFELSPIGVSDAACFDVIEDTAGNVYVFDIADPNQIESIDIINPGGETRTEWLSSSTLFNLAGVTFFGMYELERFPGTDTLIFGGATLSNSITILSARDTNGSGTINAPGELRVLWSEAGHADGFSTGSCRDFVLAPDGSLLWTDGLRNRVMRLIDRNGDGDFQDLGETTVFYDDATAMGIGLPQLEQPLSLAVAQVCTADLAEPFGVLDFSDVSAFLIAFSAMDSAADLAPPLGVFDFSDVTTFLASFGAGCP